jgi:hypothetical protein
MLTLPSQAIGWQAQQQFAHPLKLASMHIKREIAQVNNGAVNITVDLDSGQRELKHSFYDSNANRLSKATAQGDSVFQSALVTPHGLHSGFEMQAMT